MLEPGNLLTADTQDCWVVIYAKISTDKDEGIKLQGTYFGGQAPAFSLAEELARECVNSIKGGTIIPRIYKLDLDNDLVEIMFTATEKFEKEVQRMIEADRIITKSQEKRK
jgi:hypothetical protein